MLAIRDQLEDEGLGGSPAAVTLDRALLLHREVIIDELGPYFADLDRAGQPRTIDMERWWWYLDRPAVVHRASVRMGLPPPEPSLFDVWWQYVTGETATT